MKTSIARIPVQKSFCKKCSRKIKTKLLEIKNVTNVFTYEEEALIVFNFNRANQLSDVLNVLSDLGFQEKGEKRNHLQLPSFICECLFGTAHPILIQIQKNIKIFSALRSEIPLNLHFLVRHQL